MVRISNLFSDFTRSTQIDSTWKKNPNHTYLIFKHKGFTFFCPGPFELVIELWIPFHDFDGTLITVYISFKDKKQPNTQMISYDQTEGERIKGKHSDWFVNKA